MADIEDQWSTDEDREVLWNFLRVAHRDNNQLLHSTVSGLAGAVSSVEFDGLSLSVGPSIARIEKGLFAAYWSHMNMVGWAIDRFEMPSKDEFSELVARQEYDFRRLSRVGVKGVGRNDLCPCGSGKKYKGCHEGQVKAVV
ncbi:MAG: YecA family protein [Nocardioidaceae bacterium]